MSHEPENYHSEVFKHSKNKFVTKLYPHRVYRRVITDWDNIRLSLTPPYRPCGGTMLNQTYFSDCLNTCN